MPTFTTDTNLNVTTPSGWTRNGSYQLTTSAEPIIADGCVVSAKNMQFIISGGGASTQIFIATNGGRIDFGVCDNLNDVINNNATPLTRDSCQILITSSSTIDFFGGSTGSAYNTSKINMFGGSLIATVTNPDMRTFDTELNIFNCDLNNIEPWACNNMRFINCHHHDTAWAFSGVKGTFKDLIIKRVTKCFFAEDGATYDFKGIDVNMNAGGDFVYCYNSFSGVINLTNILTNIDTLNYSAPPSGTVNRFREFSYTSATAFQGRMSGAVNDTVSNQTSATFNARTATVTFPSTTWTTQRAYSFLFRSYGKNQIEFTDTVQDGVTTIERELSFVANPQITEPSVSTVQSYTELETASKFFDRFELERCKLTNFDTYSIAIMRSGTLIDAIGYDVTVDKNASTAISVSGNTITIKADTFQGSLKTTGTVTLANGATVTGAIQDSAGDSQATIRLPSGFDVVTLHATQSDADENRNVLFTGPTVRYQSSVYGGSTLWVRASSSTEVGKEVVISETIPVGAGVYIFDRAAFGQDQQLAELIVSVESVKSIAETARDHARAANVQTQS